jgi:large repetitive protein
MSNPLVHQRVSIRRGLAAVALLVVGLVVVGSVNTVHLAQADPAVGPAMTVKSTVGALASALIPDGTCRATVVAIGGGGATSSAAGSPAGVGGAGAKITATFNVFPGQTYQGSVGGAGTVGTTGATGTNGTGGAGDSATVGFGGNGGTAVSAHPGGGGGGRTRVDLAGSPVIYAGGGGGGSGAHSTVAGDGAGGVGGSVGIGAGATMPGNAGKTGVDTTVITPPALVAPVPGGGGGGTLAAGGSGGTSPGYPLLIGFAGTAVGTGTGGNGGVDANADSGGGGGGGYSGGGGGASTQASQMTGGGGGGGSSFLAATSPDLALSVPTGLVGGSGPASPAAAGPGVVGSISIDWIPCLYSLGITKTVSAASVNAGGKVSWTVEVTNTGTEPMTKGDTVDLVDTLPAGPNGLPAPAYNVTAFSVVGGTNTSMTRGAVTCAGVTIGSSMPATTNCSRPYATVAGIAQAPSGGLRGLDPGEKISITYEQIIANTAPCATITNKATVKDRATQLVTPVTGDIVGVVAAQSATADLVINCYDLQVAKTVSPALVAPGGTMTWTVTVTNLGPADMTGPVDTTMNPLKVTETFPVTGVGTATLTSATGPAGTCALAASTVTCANGLALNAVEVLTFSQTVNAGTADGTIVSNSAAVTDAKTPTTNNSATASATVDAPALTMTKTSPTLSFNKVGDVITYTISIKNIAATAVTTVNVIDPGATLGTCTPAIPVASLAAGATISCPASHTIVAADLAGSYVNTATVTGKKASGLTTSASASATTPLAKLSLAKTSPTASFSFVGDVITYSIVATNTGTATLTAVSVTDPSAVLGTCTPLAPATLLAGATLTCSATHTAVAGDLGTAYSNTATVVGTSPAGPVLTTSSTAITPFDLKPTAVNDLGTTAAGATLTGASLLTNDTGSSLTVTATTAPSHGSVTVAADGTYSYVPAAGYSGPDSFTYTVTDSLGRTSTATVNLTVTPVAATDSATTPAGTTLVGPSVLTNDLGSGLSAALTTGTTHGTLVLASDGTYTYTPATGYSGPDSFVYTAKDSSGKTTSATVYLTVAPRAIADSGSTIANTPLTGPSVLTNDLGSVLTVTANSVPAHGSVTVAPDGTYTYTPALNYTGPDSFTYTVTDASGQTATTTVTISVAPGVINDSGTTPSGVALAGTSVLGNDIGTGLSVTGNTTPTHGTLVIAADGTYTYTPTTGFSGADSFTYSVVDTYGRTGTATANLIVTPRALADSGSTAAGVTLAGPSVLGNDLGTGLTVTSNSAVSHGSVTVAADGTYSYTPAAGYSGPDSFSYTTTDAAGRTSTTLVSLTVTPRALGDLGSTPAGTVLSGSSLLANDLGSTLTVTGNTAPTHGSVSVAADGTYTYTPAAGYSGPDSFTYTVTDIFGRTATATVALTVTPKAANDSATTLANTTLTGSSVLGNDLGTGLTVTSASAVGHGTVSVAADGTYIYTPITGYSGLDFFTYTATDASGRTTTATVNLIVGPLASNDTGITPVNSVLTSASVLTNDAGTGLTVTSNTGAAHGTLTVVADGTYVYTPTPGYSGPDSFTYTAIDAGGRTSVAAVALTVTPLAVDDLGTVGANGVLNGSSVLANDAGASLMVTSNTSPSHGSVSVAADGTYSYTPALGHSGPDSFTYTATDAAGQVTTATVAITVTPTSTGDLGTTPAGTPLLGASVLANDAGTSLAVTGSTSPTHGTLTIAADGTYTYSPTAGYSGPDSFTYTATDASGRTTTATVSLTVTPRSTADTGTTPSGTVLTGTSVLTNDFGTALAVTGYTPPAHGTLTIIADGTYSYTPAAGYSGPDSFTYIATDGSGQTTTNTVSIAVTPKAVGDTGTTTANTPLAGTTVLSNDRGLGLTVSANTSPAHGSVTVAADGTYLYTPAAGYSGPDSFIYTVTDASGQTSTATVALTVSPVAVPDSASVTSGTTLAGSSVLINDSGTALTVTSNTVPAHGSVTVAADGTYLYTPAAGYSGPDSFTYTVTDAAGKTAAATVYLTVRPAALNDTGSTVVNTALTGTAVLANDLGSSLTVTANTAPAHGSVTVAAGGAYLYTPTAGYSGPDSFTYTTTDATGQTATATVNLTVTPLAAADSGSTPAGTTLSASTVLVNDFGTGLTVTGNTNPAHGSVTIAADGTYLYTPAAGYSGPDAFTYTATDASGQTTTTTVNLTVTPLAAPDSGTTPAGVTLNGPTVLANDLGTSLTVTGYAPPTHGTLTIAADGTYSYTPAAGYTGPDSFTYTATDAAGKTGTATVNLTVTPVATTDAASTPANTPLSGTTVLANDTGTTLTVTAHTAPLHGTLSIAADGTYLYTPTSGYSGPDSFTYTVTDASGNTSTATVALTVAPTAFADVATISANTTLTGTTVLTNDVGTLLTVTSNSAALHGTVTVAADGTYTYIPATGYSGPDSFTYTVTDSSGSTSTATVSLTVNPTATNDAGTTKAGVALNGSTVLSNDAGSTLTVTANSAPAHGSVTIAADGTYLYTPAPGYSGPDSFTYTTTDAAGHSATATVNIAVTPRLTADTASTPADVPLAGTTVLVNDSGTTLTVTANTSPSHGTLTIAADGTYLYTPTAGYSGPDSFTYTVTDASGQTAAASVTLAVGPVSANDVGTTSANVPLNGTTVLANDSGTSLSLTAHTSPANGTVTINPDGTYLYTPNVGYSGPDSFTYTVTDAFGQTSISTVSLTVTPVANGDSGLTLANVDFNGPSVLSNDAGSSLTITATTAPAHGTVTFVADGSYVYTPAAGYSGLDSLTYTTTDAAGQTATATVSLTVVPQAINENASTNANTPLVGASVLGNDVGTGLTVTANTAPAHGTVVIEADGTYVYTPTTGFTGTDLFTYTVTDASGQTSSATVSIHVGALAQNDTGTTSANVALSAPSVLTNDLGTGLSVISNTSPAHGTVVMLTDGTYIYTPTPGFSGLDSFTYTATDCCGVTSIGTVHLTVTPVVTDDAVMTPAETPLTGSSVALNDLGLGLTVTGMTPPSNGSLSIEPDGTYIYTPFFGYSGPDSFTYTVTDSAGQSATATVQIIVTPVARPDSGATTANTMLIGASVLSNDPGTVLTITGNTAPAHGIVTIAADGTYTYMPSPNYSGLDSFTYTMTDAFGRITAAAVYLTVFPTASVDSGTTPAGTALTALSVLGNDAGSGLTVTANTSPAHGTVSVAVDGTYVYTPTASYSGADAFTYTTTDAAGNTATSSVSLTVTPTAVDDSGSATAGVTLAGSTLLANDLGSGLSATSFTPASHGTVAVAADGTYVYTPTPGYSGSDSFTYTVTDASGRTSTATVTIAVAATALPDSGTTPANTTLAGPSVLGNDLGLGFTVSANTTPSHGTLTIAADGTYSYTPTPGYSGPDSFTYAAKDSAGQFSTATVSLTVTPTAGADTATVDASTVLVAPSVLGNDVGSALTVTASTEPSHGTVVMLADGTYTYTPTSGYSGPDSFTYTVKDASGQITSATVTLDVRPVAANDLGSTPANTPLVGTSVLTNDTGTGLTVSSNTAPAHGSVTVAADGTYVYTPTTGYSGPDSFTYTLTDAAGHTSTATVTLAVTPTAAPDFGSTPANTVLAGSTTLSNDVGSSLVAALTTGTTHGTVTIATDGTYVYTPTTGYSGPDTFTYSVTDNSGQTVTTTVSLTVVPTAAADAGTIAVGGELSAPSVLINDVGSTLTVTSNTPASHGTVTILPDGTYTYTPTTGYSGPDSFTYTVTDAAGHTSTATVTLTVSSTVADDAGTTQANTTLTGSTVLANDAGLGLTVTSNSTPTHGTVTMATDGTYVYIPTPGYSGPDAFTYTTTDAAGQTATATVTLVVTPTALGDTGATQAGVALNGPMLTANDLGSGLAITANTNPAHGTLAINPDGSYLYTPTPGFSGADSFTYTVTDSTGRTSTATVTLTVAPTASSDSGSTLAGVALNGSTVLVNDHGSVLTVTAHTPVAHGTLSIAADGTYVYTPAAGYSGPDSFTYTVTDAAGQTATATVLLTVVPAPLNDAGAVSAGSVLQGTSLLANDSGSGLTASAGTPPSHGTVVINPDGTYTYTPAAGYSGPDSFSYTITDAAGQTTTATVTLTVNPVATNDVGTTAANTVLNGASVLGNDAGSGLTVAVSTATTHGTLVLNPDGTYVYSPTSGYSGPDSFTYTVTDAAGHTTSAVVTITVTPTATVDAGTTPAGSALVGPTLLGNDVGSGLTVSTYGSPSHGTVVVATDGTYTYTPAAGYSGPDSFSYTVIDLAGQLVSTVVTITVTPAASSDSATVAANTTLNGASLLANDEGTGLTVTGNTSSAHGTLTVNPDGTYVYTPTPGYSGPDSFTYTVTDLAGNQTTATVTLTVAPTATDDTATTPANISLTGATVLGNDNGSSLAVTGYTAPSHGTLTIAADGTYLYTPTAGYSGPDSFTYTVTDAFGQSATATVNLAIGTAALADSGVTSANTTLVGTSVLANDGGSGLQVTAFTPAAHGTVIVAADGTYSYVPTPGYSGADSFTYTVTDSSGQTSIATVSLTVKPTTGADGGTTPADTPLLGTTLLSNDVGSGLSVTSFGTPSHGSVVVQADGTYVYTPNTGYSGVDSFTYTATDSSGQTSTNTVSLVVTPTATADSGTTPAGTPLSGSTVLVNDLGTGLTVVSFASPAHGTVTVASDGTYLYTPTAGYSGPDSFTYTATDARGATTTATATLSVTPAPAADSATVTSGSSVTALSVLGNDLGTTLTVTSNTAPAHGTVVMQADGTYVYMSTAGYSGTDSFTYTVTDASGNTSTATVTLTVSPTAVADTATATAGVPLLGPSVLGNDLGVGLTVTGNSPPAHGTLVMNADGTYLYTPAAGYSGPDSFTYTVTDADGHTSTATVTLSIVPKSWDDTTTTAAGVPVSINVLANDLGSALNVTGVTQPAAGLGAVSIVGGLPVFTPAVGTSGPVTFTYTVTDGSGQTTTSTVTVNVTPVATGDAIRTSVGVPLSGTTLLANDLGTGLVVTDSTQPAHGTVVVNSDGTYTYTPTAGYSGPDAFTYTVTDAAGQTSTATVTVAVGTVALPDVGTTPAGTVLNGTTVLVNDGGTGITVTSSTTPAHGVVVMNTDGTYTYTPAAGYSGPDSFDYTITDTSGLSSTTTVTLTVSPTAAADTLAATAGSAVNGTSVLANDLGTTLTVTSSTQPLHGVLVMHADGTYTYTPVAGFSGLDSFTYTVTDAAGHTSTATVSITVAPSAANDSGTVPAGGELVGPSVLGNDVGVGLTITSVGSTSHGTLVMHADGTYTYTPTPGYSGPDSFTYTVTDAAGHTSTATVALTINPVATDDTATVPVGQALHGSSVLANDFGSGLTVASNTPPAHGTLVMNADGTYTYTPVSGYSGPDSFSYTLTDGAGHTSTATVTLTVQGAAANDVGTVPSGGSVVVPVLGNDMGTGLVVSAVTQPAHGLVTIGADGTVVYVPTAGYSGLDSFTYTFTDGSGQTSSATVSITVTPTAENVVTSTTRGTAVLINVATRGHGSLVYSALTVFSPPSHGTVVVHSDGTVTYQPNPGYTGKDTFVLSAFDVAGNIVHQTVTVTVAGGKLPVSGSDARTLSALAAMLLAIGFGLTALGRRRQSAQRHQRAGRWFRLIPLTSHHRSPRELHDDHGPLDDVAQPS